MGFHVEENHKYYKTEHGSIVETSGKHGGRTSVDFDWFEEPNACCECHASPYPDIDGDDLWLTWSCDECGGGQAKLSEFTPED